MMFADSLATFQDNKTILNGVSVAADGIALAIPIIVAGSGKAIRSTEKLLDAFGGAAKGMVKTGADNVADFEKLKATLAADEILDANRVGTALSKSDAAHRSASFLTKEQLAAGKVYNLRGGDGIQRSLLQVSGEMNGNKGIFEYILTPEGDISHQLFIKGGKYTGYPNQVVPKGGW